MGLAGFLGNPSFETFGRLAQDAAEIYRPGGNLADLRQNRIAQKLLQEKAQREQEMHDVEVKREERWNNLGGFGGDPLAVTPPQIDALTPSELGVPNDVPRLPEVALVPDDVPKFQEGGMSQAPSLEDSLAQLRKPIEIINQDVSLNAFLRNQRTSHTSLMNLFHTNLPGKSRTSWQLMPRLAIQ